MPINNVPIEGDDVRWKKEVEKVIKEQAHRIAKLENQVKQLQGRIK